MYRNIKTLLAASILILFTSTAFAEWVNGYTRQNGTYVQGYHRSSPNSTVRDNYSYKGNANPYTGSIGSDYYRDNPTSEYYGTTRSNSNIWD
jgi:hypothetical protein